MLKLNTWCILDPALAHHLVKSLTMCLSYFLWKFQTHTHALHTPRSTTHLFVFYWTNKWVVTHTGPNHRHLSVGPSAPASQVPCFLLPPLSSSVHSPNCSQSGLWNSKSCQVWVLINCLLFLSVHIINPNSVPCPTRPGLIGLLSLFLASSFPTILLAH